MLPTLSFGVCSLAQAQRHLFVRSLPTLRTHFSYSSAGQFHGDHHHHHRSDWNNRGFTVGIGGPVGSGKTALVLALTKRLKEKVPRELSLTPLSLWLCVGLSVSPPCNHILIYSFPPSILFCSVGVVTNDIFTQEDADYLTRMKALPPELIKAVETGGCPHAAIREDISANLTACEDLTKILAERDATTTKKKEPAVILCESGGDNLAANFSRELADLTLYVIDVAGGEEIPRKGGPGITQSDLLVINKIDLAEAVGSDLNVMRRDAERMRRSSSDPSTFGPIVFAAVRHGTSVDDIENFILQQYALATAPAAGAQA